VEDEDEAIASTHTFAYSSRKHKVEKEKPITTSPFCLSQKKKIHVRTHERKWRGYVWYITARWSGGGGVGLGQTGLKRRDGGGMTDTSPASRGGATAFLSTGRGWRVWHHHMHRTHGAKAGLVLQDVGIGVHVDAAVTLAASITMYRIQSRARRVCAITAKRVLARFLVARRGLATATSRLRAVGTRLRALQWRYVSYVRLI